MAEVVHGICGLVAATSILSLFPAAVFGLWAIVFGISIDSHWIALYGAIVGSGLIIGFLGYMAFDS